MARRLLSLALSVCFLILPLQLQGAPPHNCHADEASPLQAVHAGHAGDGSGSPPPADAGAHHHRSPSAHAERPGAEAVPGWEVQGRYLDACRCNAPCPCHFGIRPDYDSCDPTLVFHITEGRYGEIPLEGLTAVLVTTDGKARLYLDERGDVEQRRGLEEVARTLAGTLLRDGFRLPPDQAVKPTAITAQMADDHAAITIHGVLELNADWLVGGDGGSRITLHNLDLGPSWMTQAWAGRSATYRYSDAATFEYSGRNAYFGRFAAASPLQSR